jgi:hypothetical protein
MVVDDGVHKRCADHRPVLLATLSGATSRGFFVEATLLPADVAPAATVGDVGELCDVDVDQRAWMGVLIAPQRLTGDAIDVRQPIDAAAHQHGMHGRSLQPESAGDLDRAQAVTPPQSHDLPHDLRRGPGRAGVGS